jgi:glyceraldehyde 3-phosphate dehydrogenase
VDYEAYGIRDAIVIDNTGAWRDEAGLSRHLESRGAAKVILTAPGKGKIKNIVAGVNTEALLLEDRIIAAASCTTNAIVPVLKAMNDRFGIAHGHVETVHSYTNDQNLIDNYHKKNRRGRAAPLNMVITETGASSAITKLLPELEGKITGNAIRVPTPDVSLAILNLTLDSSTSLEQVNDYLRDVSLHSNLQRQIDFTTSPDVVSSDFVGNRHASIVDSTATIANDNRVVLYVWYDNEFGYACQVLRVLRRAAGIAYSLVPAGIVV